MFVKAALLYSAMTVVSVSDSSSKLPADDNRSRSSSEDSGDMNLVNQSIGNVSLASIQEEESPDGKVSSPGSIRGLVSPGMHSP